MFFAANFGHRDDCNTEPTFSRDPEQNRNSGECGHRQMRYIRYAEGRNCAKHTGDGQRLQTVPVKDPVADPTPSQTRAGCRKLRDHENQGREAGETCTTLTSVQGKNPMRATCEAKRIVQSAVMEIKRGSRPMRNTSLKSTPARTGCP